MRLHITLDDELVEELDRRAGTRQRSVHRSSGAPDPRRRTTLGRCGIGPRLPRRFGARMGRRPGHMGARTT
nr:ribbon-helix-helix protein, CopG family [Candidatus Microthrix sp.]